MGEKVYVRLRNVSICVTIRFTSKGRLVYTHMVKVEDITSLVLVGVWSHIVLLCVCVGNVIQWYCSFSRINCESFKCRLNVCSIDHANIRRTFNIPSLYYILCNQRLLIQSYFTFIMYLVKVVTLYESLMMDFRSK